jgi:hypothetical protein
MPQAFAGNPVTGSGTVYQVPRDHSLRLELLSFTLTTANVSGTHGPVVRFYDQQLAAYTARLWDWNAGGGLMTLYYTYGIGLHAFNCNVTSGMLIEHPLPDTVLAPLTGVEIAALDSAGSVISADTITAVVLYGTFIDAVDSQPASNVDLLTGFLPSDVEA